MFEENIIETEVSSNIVETESDSLIGTPGIDGVTFTPSVSQEGIISWTNNGGLSNPEPINIKGDKGDKGEKGDTYTLTEQDKQDISNMTVESSESSFNQYYNGKLEDFNYNATSKTNDFDTNTETKTAQFNTNYNSKVQSFNENSTSKTNDYNTNATNKTTEYNTNATSKLNDYNTNASTKLQEYNTNADNKIAEYDAHSQELNNKIIDTRNELERVKNDVLETGTDSDTYIHLEDSAMAEYQELSVDGVCEQETTQGYNVLNLSKKPYDESYSTLNGATITENGGILTVDTTNATDIVTIRSKWEVYTSQNSILLPKGSYYTKLILNVVNLSGKSKGQLNGNFTLDEDCLITQWFYNMSKGHKDVKLPLLISNDQTKTDYEPYTGGQPSPSPDHPQPISTIENSLKITSCNKNIYSRKNGQYNVPIYATDGRIASYPNVNVVWVKVKPNTAYTFTLQPNQQEYYVRINQCDSNKGFIVRESQVNSKETNIVTTTETTRSNCEWLQIGINQYATAQISNNNWELMIEENSVATPFEQHLETQITANLPEGEFIGKINDTYKDTLKVEYNETDGQYHLNLYKNIGKVVLDGVNYNFPTKSSTTSNYMFVTNGIPNIKKSTSNSVLVNILCTHFINNITNVLYSNDIIGISGRTDNGLTVAFGLNSKINTKDLANNWLLENMPQVIYELDTSYIIDLGIVEMPITYNEVTNLFTDSDLLPQINAKYYRNFISTIQNLQVNEKALKQELVDINARLSALETAQTNVASESEVVG